MSETFRSDERRRRCLEFLYKACRRNNLVPRSIQIKFPCDLTGVAWNSGGFADVFKSEHRGLEVAVKVLRVSPNSDLEKITRVSYS